MRRACPNRNCELLIPSCKFNNPGAAAGRGAQRGGPHAQGRVTFAPPAQQEPQHAASRLPVAADEVKELDDQVMMLADATAQITESENLKQFLKMLLTIGNKMNEGTNKGQATGFKIGALAKITQTKTNQGTTLLEYLLSSLRVNRPEMLALPQDLAPASAAARVNLTAVTTDLRKIEKQIDSMGDMIDRGASKGDYSFVENLERFHSHAKNTVLDKVKARLAEEVAQKEAAQLQYDKLVDKERKYFKLVKEFQLECERNEQVG